MKAFNEPKKIETRDLEQIVSEIPEPQLHNLHQRVNLPWDQDMKWYQVAWSYAVIGYHSPRFRQLLKEGKKLGLYKLKPIIEKHLIK